MRYFMTSVVASAVMASSFIAITVKDTTTEHTGNTEGDVIFQ